MSQVIYVETGQLGAIVQFSRVPLPSAMCYLLLKQKIFPKGL